MGKEEETSHVMGQQEKQEKHYSDVSCLDYFKTEGRGSESRDRGSTLSEGQEKDCCSVSGPLQEGLTGHDKCCIKSLENKVHKEPVSTRRYVFVFHLIGSLISKSSSFFRFYCKTQCVIKDVIDIGFVAVRVAVKS